MEKNKYSESTKNTLSQEERDNLILSYLPAVKKSAYSFCIQKNIPSLFNDILTL
jgi:DNA-directed RNA polymerase specialized sigma subunit